MPENRALNSDRPSARALCEGCEVPTSHPYGGLCPRCEVSRLRAELEALKAHNPLTCELCHTEGFWAELVALRAEREAMKVDNDRLTQLAMHRDGVIFRIAQVVKEYDDAVWPAPPAESGDASTTTLAPEGDKP